MFFLKFTSASFFNFLKRRFFMNKKNIAFYTFALFFVSGCYCAGDTKVSTNLNLVVDANKKTIFLNSDSSRLNYVSPKLITTPKINPSPKISTHVADWTVFIFMQADNSLFPFVISDLVEMAKVGTNEKLNIIAQIDCPILLSSIFGPGNIRVRIDQGVATVVDVLPIDAMGIDVVGALIDAANWMVSDYPANHYLIDLWDHGRGILDPEPVRSILFDDTYHTFMNNQQLRFALDSIKTGVLGKNLDILGMDVCLMSMIEVGYQVKGSVDYLVSSQAPASAFGWDYSGVLRPMSEHTLTPLQVVDNIISSYKAFYSTANITNAYSQSGIEISKLDGLKNNVDLLVQNLNILKVIDAPKASYVIRKARLSSLEVDSTSNDYIDLGSFYNNLYTQLSETRQETLLPDSDAVLEKDKENKDKELRVLLPSFEEQSNAIKQIITVGLNLLNDAVVANTAGPDLALAQGLSIYFPRAETQSSYPKTLFAQESLWMELFPAQE
jgi:hypothetical protein